MVDDPRKPVDFFREIICCKTVLIFSFIFLSSFSAIADTLILKSGKTVQGAIRERTAKSIQIDVGLDFPITYYPDEVKDIILDNQINDADKPASVKNALQADAIEGQGLDLIEAGKMDEGIVLLRKAIALDPKANRHLNLGTILSGNGVALFKQGDKKAAVKTLKESEGEIKDAIKMFDPKQESIFLSQAYYLLGEMYAKGFENPVGAKEYYEKSIVFYSNPAAERGLKALSP
jgi:tetratricopeptide (TPR) repeat protein